MSARRLTAMASSLALVVTLIVAAPAAHAAGLDAPATHPVALPRGDVLLSWDAVPGASRYRVEIRSGPDRGSPLVQGQTTFARSFSPTVTLEGTEARTLYWSVAGQETASESTRGSFSDPQPLHLDALPSPQRVAPTDGAELDFPAPVTFTWQPVPGAVSYVLEYSSDSGFLSTVTTSVTTTGTSHTPTNPLARHGSGGEQITWYWRVRTNVMGPSGLVPGPVNPSPWSFRLDWPAEVSQPVLRSPAPWTAGQPEVSDPLFSWDAVPGAKEYRIAIGQYQANGLVTTPIPGSPFVTTATTFTLPRPLVNGNYFWQVTAVDASNNPGVPSEVREINRLWGMQSEATLDVPLTEAAPVPLIGSPDPATAPEIEFSEFELAWEPLPRATYYEVEVYPQNGTPVLTCKTASSSATVVAYDGTASGNPTAVKTRGTCLWHQTEARRIQPGVLYRWRVRGVDLEGTNATSFTSNHPDAAVSQWSDPQTAAYPDRRTYVRVVEDSERALGPIQVHSEQWNDPVYQGQIALESSPLLSWEPVRAYKVVEGEEEPEEIEAVGYEVRFATDPGFTTQVSRVLTPTARLRTVGVFKNNTTGLPYYWDVRPLSATNWTTTVTYMGDASVPLSWQKSTAPTSFDASGVSVAPDGTTVLSWEPQFATSPTAGGSRGYHVRVERSNGVLEGQGKFEYPFWVLHSPQSNGSFRPLADGTYRVSVAPLDADGEPGTYSAPVSVDVARKAPTGLAATVLPAGAALRWDAVNGAVSYQVRWWNAATPTAVTTSPWLGQTAMSIDNLAAGQYVAQVRTRGAFNDESSFSAPLAFTVADAAPVPLTGDRAVLPTANRVVEWNRVPGASRYLVQLAATASAVESAPAVETRSTSYAIPDDVAFGTPRYWRVTAIAERTGSPVRLGSSAVREVGFRTPPKAPQTPTLEVAGKDLAVSWTALSAANAGTDGPLQYVVRYRVADQVPASDWTTLPATSGDATSKLVTGLQRGTTYEFQVSAKSGEGHGPWSTSRKGSAASLPAAPKGLQVQARLDGITLRWQAVTGSAAGGTPVTGYVLRYRKAGAGGWTQRVLGTVTTVDIAGLSSGATYELELAAVNAVGTGPAATVSGQVLAVPTAPRSVSVKARDRTLDVSWRAPSSDGGNPVTSYVVQYRSYAKKTWSPWTSRTVSASSTSLQLTGLTNGSKYQVMVAARSRVGDGPSSKAVSATPAGKPLAPTKVKVKALKKKTRVSWNKAAANGSKVTKYVVQWSKNGKKWKKVKTLKASKRKITTKVGKKGRTVYFRVIARNKLGKSAPSAVVSVVKR